MARGHLVKRADDSWSIVVELERDPTTGKRRQKWTTVKGTKREAEKRLTELLTDADRGTIGTSPKMTVADFLDRWIRDYAESNTSPKTCLEYRGLIRRHIVPHIGRVALAKLRPSHILRLQTILRETERGNGRGGMLSSTTRRHAHTVLHTALEHAVQWKLLSSNPASAVDAPIVSHTEMQTFSPDEASAFLREAQGEGLYWEALFMVAMTCGLRVSELRGLRWHDLDFDGGTLVVRQTIQRLPRQGIVVKAPKTTSSRRPVAIGPQVVALLRRHKAGQNADRLQLGSGWADYDLVFPSYKGEPFADHAVRATFGRLCQRAGVPRIRLHDLRHTAATLLLVAGVNPKVVSERLGHSNITITLQTYSHVSQTMQQAAADTLDGLVHRPAQNRA